MISNPPLQPQTRHQITAYGSRTGNVRQFFQFTVATSSSNHHHHRVSQMRIPQPSLADEEPGAAQRVFLEIDGTVLQNELNNIHLALEQARTRQFQFIESMGSLGDSARDLLRQVGETTNAHHSSIEESISAAEKAAHTLREVLALATLQARASTAPVPAPSTCPKCCKSTSTLSRSSSFSEMETDTDIDELIRSAPLSPNGGHVLTLSEEDATVPQLTPVNAIPATPRGSRTVSSSPAATASPLRRRNRRAGGHMVIAGRDGQHGVFTNWAEANNLISGVSNPMHRSFDYYTQAKSAYDACVKSGLAGTLSTPWNPSQEWFVLLIGDIPGIHQRLSLMHAIGLANFERLTNENIMVASSKEEADQFWREHEHQVA
ncbi:hypothetical protein VNI00_004657 [Paramarasmius palmivorus]|uniref:Ribonuclease H1 N-terminal domain-containing protein n=1 Tax=Paramarasmius palmivorus TaxID=297713 RepID=A0AAW0DIE2_9AGAR